MVSLTAHTLLAAWERGLIDSPSERAIVLLEAAGEGPRDRLESLPIGRRDALLLDLRERTFGDRLECVTRCPGCQASVELTLRVADLHSGSGEDFPQNGKLEVDGSELSFRLPNSTDLQAANRAGDVALARRTLIERCVTGEGMLSEMQERRVADAMERLDPLASVRLALSCSQCAHAWKQRLDVAQVIWAEIHAWAQRVLRDVHVLATAYGWSESEILGLSARRRRTYLAMVSA